MAVVIVTGGAGYVGSHACKALAEAGHTPVCLDNLNTGWRDLVVAAIMASLFLHSATKIIRQAIGELRQPAALPASEIL